MANKEKRWEGKMEKWRQRREQKYSSLHAKYKERNKIKNK